MEMRKRALAVIATILLAAMLCFFLASIFYLNFSITPSFYTTDMYADVMVAVNMWEQKTLLPETWVFGNQLYILSTPVLAALIYGITGNAFKAMAAAASLMAVFVIASFDWMLKAVFKRPRERLFGIVGFLSVVALFGDAVLVMNGWQLFFTMCAYYACYAVNAFLAFGCYLRSEKKLSGVTVGLVCVLSFAMGIQSLRQTAVMALPMMGLEFLRVIRRIREQKPIASKSLYIASAISVSNVAGVLCKGFLKVNQVEIIGEISLAKLQQLPGAFCDSIANACSLFSRDTAYPNMLYQTVLLLFVLTGLLVYRKTKRSAASGTNILFALLALSVLAIFGIDVVTTMSVRGIYYFMLFPLVACLAVYLYTNQQVFIKLPAFLLLCVVFCCACTQQVIPACKQAQDRMYDGNYEISNYLLDQQYTTVYSSWNGCERIAAASQGRIRAGFWSNNLDPFIPVPYLCDPVIYTADPERVAYVFYGKEEAEAGLEKARNRQIRLIPVAEYPDEDIYIYTAPVNLLYLFSPDE